MLAHIFFVVMLSFFSVIFVFPGAILEFNQYEWI